MTVSVKINVLGLLLSDKVEGLVLQLHNRRKRYIVVMTLYILNFLAAKKIVGMI